MAPLPAKRSWKGGSLSGLKITEACGCDLFRRHVSSQLDWIAARALSRTRLLPVFSQSTNSLIMPNNSSRLAFACALDIPAKYPRSPPGSLTIWEKITALAAATGRWAHHLCSVVGYPPGAFLFRRAASSLMASSGSATSMSFFGALIFIYLSLSQPAFPSQCSQPFQRLSSMSPVLKSLHHSHCSTCSETSKQLVQK